MEVASATGAYGQRVLPAFFCFCVYVEGGIMRQNVDCAGFKRLEVPGTLFLLANPRDFLASAH